MDIVCCPSCGQPAEVMWRRSLASTHGLVEHAALRCLARHVLVMPALGLIPMTLADAGGEDSAVQGRVGGQRWG
ncbi:MAG TPA: hypothetical protein VE441_12860 [Mycobacterium sp.]|nr:hypothetical protein [Mycobacterium sp.]